MGIYDQIKAAIQDILAPELHARRADTRRLDQKIDGILDARIDGVDRELRTPIDIRERLGRARSTPRLSGGAQPSRPSTYTRP